MSATAGPAVASEPDPDGHGDGAVPETAGDGSFPLAAGAGSLALVAGELVLAVGAGSLAGAAAALLLLLAGAGSLAGAVAELSLVAGDAPPAGVTAELTSAAAEAHELRADCCSALPTFRPATAITIPRTTASAIGMARGTARRRTQPFRRRRLDRCPLSIQYTSV
jgi:hypothetical protein